MKRVLLTGANGFVGSRIARTFSNRITAAPSLRNMSEESIRQMVEESEADVVIHTAAISSIPACEADPQEC